MFKKKLVLFLIVLFCQPLTYGKNEKNKFISYNTSNGLTNNAVECIVQDKYGKLWIGTHLGLNIFKSFKFEKIHTKNKALESLSINCLLNTDSKIWIGTNQNGVFVYDQKLEKYLSVPIKGRNSELINYSVHSIFSDFENKIWVGTNDGIYKYDRSSNQLVAFKVGMPKMETINCHVSSKHIGLVIGTDGNGLLKMNSKTNTFVAIKNKNLPKRIKTICLTNEGLLWVGTWDQGIYIIDPISFEIKMHLQHTNARGSLSSNIVTKIIQDYRNTIWVSTINGGLNRYNDQTGIFQVYQNIEFDSYSLPSNSITDIFEDRNNDLWLTSHGGGISYYSNHKELFDHFNKQKNQINSLSNNNITSFVELSKGQIWISTDGGGVNEFYEKTKSFKSIKNTTQTIGNQITSIYKKDENSIWFSSWGKGFGVFPEKGPELGKILQVNSKLSSNENVKSFLVDDTLIWLASHNKDGIKIYDSKTGIFYDKINPGKFNQDLFSIEWSTCFAKDSKGRVWIGTYAGLYVFDPKGVRKFLSNQRDTNSLSSNSIYTLYVDNQKNMWIGSQGGLDLLKDEKEPISFERFGAKILLPVGIKSICNDEFGDLWLGSAEGLIRLKLDNKEYEIFSKKDGVYLDEFNERACFRSSTNQMYFGGTNGFVTFSPKEINPKPFDQKVVIDELYLFNQLQLPEEKTALKVTMTETAPLVFDYEDKMIGFGFSTPLMSPENVIYYSYILEGFDDEWHTIEGQQKVTFTNLKAGSYTLKIKASDLKNFKNSTEDVIHFTVTPPFWRTWWFGSLVLLSILIVVYLVIRIRIHQIKIHNKKLKKLVKIKTEQILIEKETQKQQEHENHALLVKQKQLEADRANQEKELSNIKNEILSNEIKQKQIDIDRKNVELTSMAMQNTSVNELINQVNQKLSELENSSEKNISIKLAAIKRDIKANAKNQLEWNQFDKIFNEIHDNFLNRLKQEFDDLTAKDLQFCTYLRMNLDSNEIAQLLNITQKGIEKARWRVRKKLNLSSKEDLNSYILKY